MTEYLHTHNLVINPEQGTRQPDGTCAQDTALVPLDAPGPECRRPVAVTLTPEQHASSVASSYSPRPNTTPAPHPRPEGDDQ